MSSMSTDEASVVISVESSFSGSFSGSIDGAELFVGNLPTVDPGVAGQLYNDSGAIKISL